MFASPCDDLETNRGVPLASHINLGLPRTSRFTIGFGNYPIVAAAVASWGQQKH